MVGALNSGYGYGYGDGDGDGSGDGEVTESSEEDELETEKVERNTARDLLRSLQEMSEDDLNRKLYLQGPEGFWNGEAPTVDEDGDLILEGI